VKAPISDFIFLRNNFCSCYHHDNHFQYDYILLYCSLFRCLRQQLYSDVHAPRSDRPSGRWLHGNVWRYTSFRDVIVTSSHSADVIAVFLQSLSERWATRPRTIASSSVNQSIRTHLYNGIRRKRMRGSVITSGVKDYA